MIVFLIIWLVVLTALTAIGFLMAIGKFVKLERAVDEVLENLHDDIEEIHGVFDAFLKDFRNLKTQIENLPKTDENPSEVSQQIAQLETRIDNLALSEKTARQDINLLLSADKEHPVLVPNKGGRPRKETGRDD